MKIIIERPPVYDAVCAAFNINPQSAVFTYGEDIYNPNNIDLPEHILIHEAMHVEQQKLIGGPELWWGKFLREPSFRVDQEAQAYGAQYAYICTYTKGREQQFKVLRNLAQILSGKLYNNVVSGNEAMALIKKYSKI